MIELSPLPGGRSVAERTGLRERGGHMVGRFRCLIVLQVAPFTRRSRSLEDIVHVARSAVHGGVLAGQWELRRGRVIEFGSLPLRGRVTQRAVLREACRCVIRSRCFLEVRKMAPFTRHRRSAEHVVNVAGGANHRSVFSCELEPGRRVIEFRSLPLRRRVTRFTSLREAGGDVIDALCGLVIVQMAGNAARRQTGEFIVHVAGSAGHRCVFARQCELCRGVIERGPLPLRRGVAGFTVL